MKKTTRFGLCVVALGATTLAAQDTTAVKKEIDSTRDSISAYVRVRQDIARDRNEWQAEKEIIQRRIELFEQEKADLQEQIKEAESKASSAQQVIAQKQDTINKLTSATDVVQESLPEYESRIADLVQYLPEDLKKQLEPLTSKLGNSSTSNRMAVVVGVLNQLERYNNQFNFTTDTKQTGEGQSKSVDVMYVGLGQGYYVDQEGTIAGVGIPAKGGWKWTERNDLAPQIRRAIAYYNGEIKPAEFVQLPVDIKDAQPNQ
ncbi:MAG: hypothetical protein E1N59_1953 [Puniceicoccaceae bacterium 5H]|nr:MAG: hypothetical protein E1N59_1953 [Puniceicoccaceae bacterium 5H]